MGSLKCVTFGLLKLKFKIEKKAISEYLQNRIYLTKAQIIYKRNGKQ